MYVCFPKPSFPTPPTPSLLVLAVSQKQVCKSLSWNYLNKKTRRRGRNLRGDFVMSAVCLKATYSKDQEIAELYIIQHPAMS